MRKKLKAYTLVFCLFTFLFLVLEGSLRLKSGAAFIAAVTGTPVLIYAFKSIVTSRSVPGGPHRQE